MFVYQRVDIRSARKNQLRSVTVSVLGSETIWIALQHENAVAFWLIPTKNWNHVAAYPMKPWTLDDFAGPETPKSGGLSSADNPEGNLRRVPWPWDSYGLPTTNKRDKRRVAQLLPCNLLENTYWMWENLLESPLSLSHTQATEGGGSLLFLASLSTLERRWTSICQGATGYRRKVLKVV